MPRALAAFFTILLTATLGVYAQTDAPAWPIREAPVALRPAIDRANLLRVEIHAALLSELQTKLAKGGATLALRVCHMRAASTAREMAVRDGVLTGLTSDRLRNPRNAAPEWAAALIASHAGARADTTDGYAVDLGTTIGILQPITEGPVCATCHGPLDRIDPAVREALASRYPADAAHGFRPGEVRGWFWAVVPKQ